ncbi:MAG: Rrf2 family transcriptional regulator [Clostridia bacterium]|nr:Rrf2 family transcriptional regulator [Clostridia bacterium]
MISTRGRYALRLMTALAKRTESAPLRELAEQENVPYKYAEAIMSSLVRAGFVESTRGKNGGYSLTRAPEAYTLAEVLNETEISLAATDCTGRKEAECPHASTCPTLPVWRALDETVTNFLSGYTLVDLMPK